MVDRRYATTVGTRLTDTRDFLVWEHGSVDTALDLFANYDHHGAVTVIGAVTTIVMELSAELTSDQEGKLGTRGGGEAGKQHC